MAAEYGLRLHFVYKMKDLKLIKALILVNSGSLKISQFCLANVFFEYLCAVGECVQFGQLQECGPGGVDVWFFDDFPAALLGDDSDGIVVVGVGESTLSHLPDL